MPRLRPWIIVAVLAVVGAAAFFVLRGREGSAEKWRTQAVDRGAVEVTVSATGTIQPVEKVEVGSQASGTLSWLGADFNDRVRKGQVIAQLEPSSYRTAVAQSEANLARAQAAFSEASRNFERSRELKERNVIAQVDLDAAEAAFDQRKAEVKQAQASLQSARVNLGYTTITSPIDGVIIARAVDIGQTVAASLSAPKLFQIAGDLTRMQVETKIDEADIGRVAPGLSATFTVDAFPEDTFEGTVRQVRLEPLIEQNVVTYTTVIDVSNPELKLKPGMTANVTIRIEKKDDVLRVPNAALRFRPPETPGKGGSTGGGARTAGASATAAGGAGGAQAAAGEGRPRGRRPGGAGGDSTGARRGPAEGHQENSASGGAGGAGGAPDGKRQMVYTLGAEGKLEPRRVATGITDGTHTELRSRELAEGALVVTGAMPKKGQAAGTGTAPPGMGGPGGQRGGGGMRRF